MDKRRTTRGRSKRVEELGVQPVPVVVINTNSALNKRNSVAASNMAAAAPASPARRSSPARRASPARSRTSPVRRSSRPRSTVFGSSASTATVAELKTTPNITPVKEIKEPTSATKSQKNNLPTTLTTNTSSRAPGKTNLTASVHSSYSSTTQKTIEIRSSTATIDSEVAKFTDFIRRSVSKTFSVSRSREGTRTPATTTEASRNSRSVSQSVFNDDNYFKAAEFSDNEQEEEDIDEPGDHYKSFNVTTESAASVVCRKIEVPQEYGGWLGATALMLLIPTVVYYLQWSCATSASCKLIQPDLIDTFNRRYIAGIFEPDALAAYMGFTMGVFVLSASLFGRRVRLPNDRLNQQYNFNAFPIAVLLAIIGCIAIPYFKFPLADFVLKHYLRFCLYGLINAFIIAIWAYCRTNYIKDGNIQLNIYGRSGNLLIDFALGRQINPKWFGVVEFKQVFYRISLLSTLLFSLCFIYKSLHIPTLDAMKCGDDKSILSMIMVLVKYYYRNVQYEPAALLSATMLLTYIVDAVLFEHHLASSFELQGEGFGNLLLLRYAATPYLLSSVAKYFLERRVGSICCRYGVYVAVVLFFSGLFVKRISSAIKYKYRIDPNNPLFGGIETIHTFQGRRLLLGSFWGQLRQPNYAGDIMALSGLAVPLFLRFAWPPALCILLLITVLLHRCVRVNARNLSRYHSSWVRYCTKVRNYVVPKVY